MTPQSSASNGGGNMKITWEEAVRWTKNFRKKFQDGAGIKGYTITTDTINALLTQGGNNLQGIKTYFGYDEDKNFRLIVVAVIGDNFDDYDVPAKPVKTAVAMEDEMPILGDTRPCPVYCGTPNILNDGE